MFSVVFNKHRQNKRDILSHNDPASVLDEGADSRQIFIDKIYALLRLLSGK